MDAALIYLAWFAGLLVSLVCAVVLIWRRPRRLPARLTLALLALLGVFWWLSIYWSLAYGPEGP